MIFALLPSCFFDSSGVDSGSQQETGLFPDQIDLAPDFTLVDQFGKEFNLTDQKGQNSLLFFGYTSCPDICPSVLAKLARLLQDDRYSASVSVIFVSVDNKLDTTNRIREYLSRFDKSMIGLTGNEQQVDKVKSDYGVYSSKYSNSQANPESNPLLSHSDYIYLIDAHGFLVGYYHQDTAIEVLQSDLDILRDR
jgi:protein SCO1/2